MARPRLTIIQLRRGDARSSVVRRQRDCLLVALLRMVLDDLPRFGIPKGSDVLDEALDLRDPIVRASTLAALEAGGVINDHHGVGLQLAPCLERGFGAKGMGLLQGIKSAIDPSHLLYPGKLGTQS